MKCGAWKGPRRTLMRVPPGNSQSQLCEGYKHTIWQKRNILAENKWHVCLSVFTFELFSFLKKNHKQKPWAFGPGGPHDRLRLMTPNFSLFFFFGFHFNFLFSPSLCLPHTEKRIFGYHNHFNFCGILLTTLTPHSLIFSSTVSSSNVALLTSNNTD